jgi:hypothetical protein
LVKAAWMHLEWSVAFFAAAIPQPNFFEYVDTSNRKVGG